MTDAVHFRFRFDPLFTVAGLPLGIREDSCRVTVDDDSFDVRFGPWHLVTSRSNVASAEVTGPYFVPKVIGPPHLSLADRGISFATNSGQGVCVGFHRPVPGLLPVPWLRHPGATVTVDNPAALVELLGAAPEQELDDALAEVHDDLVGMSAAQLRARAKDLGIRGTASMSKAELLVALEPAGVGATTA